MRALILVDLQNDFMPGGSLAVPDGDAVIPIANALVPKFELVVATQDWHPPGHGSFATSHIGLSVGDVIDLDGLQQVMWPDHCVQRTEGAAFVTDLDAGAAHVFRKGMDPGVDSYSGFFDNGHRNATGLGDFLKENDVDEVVLLGVATDYCVKYTALDARELGFEVTLVRDGCRGVNLGDGDDEDAIEEMVAAGVKLVESSSLL